MSVFCPAFTVIGLPLGSISTLVITDAAGVLLTGAGGGGGGVVC